MPQWNLPASSSGALQEALLAPREQQGGGTLLRPWHLHTLNQPLPLTGRQMVAVLLQASPSPPLSWGLQVAPPPRVPGRTRGEPVYGPCSVLATVPLLHFLGGQVPFTHRCWAQHGASPPAPRSTGAWTTKSTWTRACWMPCFQLCTCSPCWGWGAEWRWGAARAPEVHQRGLGKGEKLELPALRPTWTSELVLQCAGWGGPSLPQEDMKRGGWGVPSEETKWGFTLWEGWRSFQAGQRASVRPARCLARFKSPALCQAPGQTPPQETHAD